MTFVIRLRIPPADPLHEPRRFVTVSNTLSKNPGSDQQSWEKWNVSEKVLQLEIDESHCTKCGLCEERASGNLEMAGDEPYARVIKQPAGDSEMRNCIEAVDYCPTGGLTATETSTLPEDS